MKSGKWTFVSSSYYWRHRNGEIVLIERPLVQGEADLDETGPMYRIKFLIDNYELDAFDDELIAEVS